MTTKFNYPKNARQIPKSNGLSAPSFMTKTEAGTLVYNKPQTEPNIPGE